MPYFYVTRLDWVPGAVIDNDMFHDSPQKRFFEEQIPADLVGVDDYLARRQAELLLEKTRVAGFSDEPSRRDAIFLNESLESAIKWTEKPARRGSHIYELEELQCDASTVANYLWYNYLVRLFRNPQSEFRTIFADQVGHEKEKVAEAYWQNEASEPWGAESLSETLFIGSLRVIQRNA